jgi:hypothetical protein
MIFVYVSKFYRHIKVMHSDISFLFLIYLQCMTKIILFFIKLEIRRIDELRLRLIERGTFITLAT